MASGFVVPERPPLPSNVTVDLEETTYRIEGTTVDELNASMRERTPFRDDQGNRLSDGYTAWNLDWDFRPVPTTGGCRLEGIRVTLSLTTTVYDWTPPPGVPADLIAAVESARTRLLEHEREHQTINILGALDVADLLRKRSVASQPCDRLQASVNAEGRRILERLRSVNRAFDVATQSGKVQAPGAR